jgi:hypothetical protein
MARPDEPAPPPPSERRSSGIRGVERIAARYQVRRAHLVARRAAD